MAEIKEKKGIMTPPGELIVGGQADPKEDVVRDQMSVADRLAFLMKK